MPGLILETSTEKSCIVLEKEGEVIAHYPMLGGPELSKTLALHVKNLLLQYSFHPDYVAVGTGPGSYTGVRVGASLGQALAFGWKIPVLGFCGLESFVIANCPVLVDARMRGFYLYINGTAKICSLSEVETECAHAPCIATPHPTIVQSRLALSCTYVESAPQPSILAQMGNNLFSEKTFPPFSLTYLSSP